MVSGYVFGFPFAQALRVLKVVGTTATAPAGGMRFGWSGVRLPGMTGVSPKSWSASQGMAASAGMT
jgi:hypothetical protein